MITKIATGIEASSLSKKEAKYEDFAKRLDIAMHQNSEAPSTHGRQKWLRERLSDRYNIDVSSAAVQKWFSGESLPRPAIMTAIAQALECDDTWLRLGINPAISIQRMEARSKIAAGHVNLVAGIIQINGGVVAFPIDGGEAGVDLITIIDSRQHNLEIKTPIKSRDGAPKWFVNERFVHRTVIAVVQDDAAPFAFRLFRVTNAHIATGFNHGGYIEVNPDTTWLPEIVNVADMDGVTRQDRSRRQAKPAANEIV